MAEKRPPKKAAARKKPARKAPAKRRAKPSAATIAKQEKALNWAVAHGAPLMILEGWDPKTGAWTATSPVGKALRDIQNGAHVGVAARRHDVRHLARLVDQGRSYLEDETMSEDRDLIPLDIRPFVDLFLAVDGSEAELEISIVEKTYAAAKHEPGKYGFQFLGRRFPERWREQSEIRTSIEHDNRDAAVADLLANPNTAAQLAQFAREAEDRAAAADASELE